MTTAHTPSRVCYQRGCPSPECARTDYRYRKQLDLEHSRGQYRLHDATQAIAHVQRLIYAGWTNPQIAEASGIGVASIQKLANNKQKKLNSGRAAAILAIEIGPPPANTHRVNAVGTIRRLRALNYIGHAHRDIAPQLGMTLDRLTDIAAGRVTVVRPTEAEAVARLYRRLSLLPGARKQVATAARNKGWHGPLVWDDIDDPNCEPEIDKQPGVDRRRKTVVDIDLVARRTKQGRTAEEIARELGCHKRSVVRARSRAAELAQAA